MVLGHSSGLFVECALIFKLVIWYLQLAVAALLLLCCCFVVALLLLLHWCFNC